MKVNSLIEHLEELPQEADVVLNRFLIIHDDEDKDDYHLRLDIPIIGTAISEDQSEVLMILNCDRKIAEKNFNAEVTPL